MSKLDWLQRLGLWTAIVLITVLVPSALLSVFAIGCGRGLGNSVPSVAVASACAIGMLEARLARVTAFRCLLWSLWQGGAMLGMLLLFPTQGLRSLPITLFAPVLLQIPLLLLALGPANLRPLAARSALIGATIWIPVGVILCGVSQSPDPWLAALLFGMTSSLRNLPLIRSSAAQAPDRGYLPLRWFLGAAAVLSVLAVLFSSGALRSSTSRTVPLAIRRLDQIAPFLMTDAHDAVFTYRDIPHDRYSERERYDLTDLDRARNDASHVWSIAVQIDPKLAPEWVRLGPFESPSDEHLAPELLDGLIPADWGAFKEAPITIQKETGKPYADYRRTVYPRQGVVLIMVYR